MKSITYAITVCNEHEEINRLLSFLIPSIRHNDDILVLYDSKNGSPAVMDVIAKHKVPFINRPFDDHFGRHKNFLIDRCNGDYVFLLDADEVPQLTLLNSLPEFLEKDMGDLLVIPRINIIPDMTTKQNETLKLRMHPHLGYYNWPDYQARIFKNNVGIRYDEDQHLHEMLKSDKVVTANPSPMLALWHVKYVNKQMKQHDYYETLNQTHSP